MTVQLLAPLLLAGLPLPAGTILRLGVDVAVMLLHQRRAKLVNDPRFLTLR
jgi:hypothetical protein